MNPIPDRGEGADWLQLDGPGLQPADPTLATPPWVTPDSPPTLERTALTDLPVAWPEIPGYEIVAELGRGGMGVVYQARQLRLNRWVALKMILSGVHADSKDLARFPTEAEAVAQLHHPSIVQIYEIGTHLGLPFLALEYVDGRSLHKVVSGSPQPPQEAAAMLENLARAMHAAHAKQIVHRDLKPANILLVDSGSRFVASTEKIADRRNQQPHIPDFDAGQDHRLWLGQTVGECDAADQDG